MPARKTAEQIVAAIGGMGNLRACGVCATRLRILVNDVDAVDHDALESIRGVLGVFRKGIYGLELVLGPRLVANVSGAIYSMTGVRSSIEELSGFNTPSDHALSIQVSNAVGDAAPQRAEAPVPAAASDDDEESEAIDEMLQSIEEDGQDVLPRSVLVINGPNINMLGIREPGIYGRDNYAHLIELCMNAATEAGFDSCECLQSNHEGDLVDYIQGAYSVHDGIVINPAAYTHTSIALLDAIKAVAIPTVEVHISDIGSREEFRQASYVREACIATISGHGIEGYREAILLLAQHLGI